MSLGGVEQKMLRVTIIKERQAEECVSAGSSETKER